MVAISVSSHDGVWKDESVPAVKIEKWKGGLPG